MQTGAGRDSNQQPSGSQPVLPQPPRGSGVLNSSAEGSMHMTGCTEEFCLYLICIQE